MFGFLKYCWAKSTSLIGEYTHAEETSTFLPKVNGQHRMPSDDKQTNMIICPGAARTDLRISQGRYEQALLHDQL